MKRSFCTNLVVLLLLAVLKKCECRAETDIYVSECKSVQYSERRFANKEEKLKWKNPVIHLFLDRETLAVTEYPGTPSVNLALNATVIIKDISIKKEEKISLEIIGVANVFKLDKKFRDCTVYTRSFDGSTFFIQPSALNRAFDQCVSSVICEKLGSLDNQDIINGKETPYSFGPTSLESRSIIVMYPDIYPPRVGSKNVPKQYKKSFEAVYHIVDSLAEGFNDHHPEGIVSTPDVKNGSDFVASQGTVKGFGTIQIDTRTPIDIEDSKKDLKHITFDFGIPFGQLKYTSFWYNQAWKDSLCVEFKELFLTANLTLNYQQEKCQSTLNELKAYPGKLEMKHCKKTNLIPDLVKKQFTSLWKEFTVPSLRDKLEKILHLYLKDLFDCKQYIA